MNKPVRVVTFGLCLLSAWQGGFAAPIRLKTGEIDPSAARPKLMATAPEDIPARGLYLIQHDGVTPPEWRERVKATGAVLRDYIPENAWIVEASAEAYAKLCALPHSYLGEYKGGYRIEPGAKAAAVPTGPRLAAAVPISERQPTHMVLLFDETVRAAVAVRIAALPGCDVLTHAGDVIPARLTEAAIDEIAGWLEVSWIERYVRPKLCNNVAVKPGLMNAETVWPGGASGLGLTGKGQVVAVADTGFDTGDMGSCHLDVRGRILSAYALNRKRWNDLDGHGTHVAGSVLGNGATLPIEGVKGLAYEARLVVQSIATDDGGISVPSPLSSLFKQASTNQNGEAGAFIHSNSWGADSKGAYTTNSRYLDDYTFAHPDILVLFAAGNEGADADGDGVVDLGSLNAPASAKNCLTIGASESVRLSRGTWGAGWPKDFPSEPIAGDQRSQSADGVHRGMAAFSSRGPCQDGRIKPDLVAPGTDILSLYSQTGSSTGWGVPTFPGTILKPYMYSGGTSMATPLAAGAAALVRQWLIEKRSIALPDAATLKAVLMAGARSLAPGQYGTGAAREIPATYPNNVEGWGEVNLGGALTNDVRIWDAQVIAAGETLTYELPVVADGMPLSIVMAYADAKAATSSAVQLVNDLDLTVTTPSETTLYPNSGTGPDRRNNVEGVRIATAESGTYLLKVKAYAVNSAMKTEWTGGKANALRFSLVANATPRPEKRGLQIFIRRQDQ